MCCRFPAIAYSSWQDERLGIAPGDLEVDSLLPKSVTSISRDAAEVLSRVDSVSLECIAKDTTILKRTGDSIAFSHPVFRDILAANYLCKRLRTSEQTDISTNVGSFVVELLPSYSA
jgi:hypothetical protein